MGGFSAGFLDSRSPRRAGDDNVTYFPERPVVEYGEWTLSACGEGSRESERWRTMRRALSLVACLSLAGAVLFLGRRISA